jgi:hypothetical protein
VRKSFGSFRGSAGSPAWAGAFMEASGRRKRILLSGFSEYDVGSLRRER